MTDPKHPLFLCFCMDTGAGPSPAPRDKEINHGLPTSPLLDSSIEKYEISMKYDHIEILIKT